MGFTLGHLFVSHTWARALVDGSAGGCGIGRAAGPVRRRRHGGLGGLLSALLGFPDVAAARRTGGGRNRRRQCRLHPGVVDATLTVVQRRLLGSGVPSAPARGRRRCWAQRVAGHRRLQSIAPLRSGASLRHRYAHGRHFGASRVAHGFSALRIVAAAPLVPLILAWRAARRALPAPEHRRRFLLALPLFLVLAVGVGRRRSARRARRSRQPLELTASEASSQTNQHKTERRCWPNLH